MICDCVRWLYTGSMKFWPGGPSIPVRWYVAPPGAKPVPFFHQFGSRIWDDDRVEQVEGLGEDAQDEYPETDYHTPPSAKGQSYCGRPEWWVSGQPAPPPFPAPTIPFDIWGLPGCCNATPGGPAIGGGNLFGPFNYGGPMLGGTAILPFGFLLVADGGLQVDGSGWNADWTFSGGGGVEVGGEAGNLDGFFVGDGGVEVGGEAGNLDGFFVGNGGGLVGGTAY
jgi:hypothetical protein